MPKKGFRLLNNAGYSGFHWREIFFKINSGIRGDQDGTALKGIISAPLIPVIPPGKL